MTYTQQKSAIQKGSSCSRRPVTLDRLKRQTDLTTFFNRTLLMFESWIGTVATTTRRWRRVALSRSWLNSTAAGHVARTPITPVRHSAINYCWRKNQCHTSQCSCTTGVVQDKVNLLETPICWWTILNWNFFLQNCTKSITS